MRWEIRFWSNLCYSDACIQALYWRSTFNHNCVSLCRLKMNQIAYLLRKPFSQHSLQEKIEIRNLGPPRPRLNGSQAHVSSDRGRNYRRNFNTEWYSRCEWLCGSDELEAVFCFPCVLFGGDHRWTLHLPKIMSLWRTTVVYLQWDLSCHKQAFT